MKHLLLLPTIVILLSANSISYCQQADTLIPNEAIFHDPSAYIDFQFPEGDDPLITTQIWGYVKKMYVEARYNYEDRQTFSLYCGRTFKIGQNNEFEIIPMLGGSVGRFNGISPATTMILEAGWIRGFSQNQYSINLKEQGSNFFFDWSSLVFHIHEPLYMGVSLQTFIPKNYESQIYFAPMISIKKLPFVIEGFAYNFWKNNKMYAFGLQYYY